MNGKILGLSAVIAIFAASPAWSAVSALSDAPVVFESPVNTEPTRYEVLKAHFESATTPADPAFFDAFDDTASTQQCRYALNKDAALATQYALVYTKEIPGNGPLFPGKTVKKIVVWGSPSLESARGTYRNLIDKLFDDTTNETTATGLMVHETGLGDGTVDAEFRQDGNTVVYKMILTNGASVSTLYGYCWK